MRVIKLLRNQVSVSYILLLLCALLLPFSFQLIVYMTQAVCSDKDRITSLIRLILFIVLNELLWRVHDLFRMLAVCKARMISYIDASELIFNSSYESIKSKSNSKTIAILNQITVASSTILIDVTKFIRQSITIFLGIIYIRNNTDFGLKAGGLIVLTCLAWLVLCYVVLKFGLWLSGKIAHSRNNLSELTFTILENISLSILRKQKEHDLVNLKSSANRVYKTEIRFEILALSIYSIQSLCMIGCIYYILKPNMEIGLIIALTQYITNMSMNLLDGIENIAEIANQLGILSHGINSIGRDHHHKPATTSEEVIQANNLTHRDIKFPDFTIQNGETVLITGPSGSGKTTLLNLIAGLMKPDEGSLANGIDYNFGYLPQDIALFRNTLEYNLRYGTEGDLDQLINNPMYNFVHKMPNGLKTVICESVVSAGEKQRIGIARCVLSGASILLLDEPFTRLDEANQLEIIKLLYSIKSTKVIVTHNLSKIPEGFADKIIKLG